MQNFKAPERDTFFVSHELLDMQSHYQKLGFDEASEDLVRAIYTEAAKFSENILAPINAIGDKEGCTWTDGVVTTPSGFKSAYQQYVDGGWPSMVQPETFGGQGLPFSLSSSISEWFAGANHAWALYPGLGQGAMETIKGHGTPEQKEAFLPKLVEGAWAGTMCLTEPHAGTDLGMLKCKAEPNEDGTYNITGTKIFITGGEHDLTDNIVHIVLARIVGAPQGTKGISLFIVPKYHLDENGEAGERNSVACGSIEHKMGIKGSATCVMNFDGAKGQLLGPPNRGLNSMFIFMNMARIGVAVEGLAASEAAFQGALSYATDRLQMRSMSGPKNPELPADPIIVHPDVRRMLLTQKSIAEGCRALANYCMKLVDLSEYSKDENEVKVAEAKLAFITPILKAFLTETAQEATSYGIQVYGGHGYIAEWGMEQLARDTRISTVYEGTTGIQALDLLGRKVMGSKGELLNLFTQEVKDYCASIKGETPFESWNDLIGTHIDEWHEITGEIGKVAAKNPDEIGAASVDYLMYSGYVMLGYFWLQMAVVAQRKLDEGTTDVDFYKAKLHTAKFYFERMLPRTRSLVATMSSGADNLMEMDADLFKVG